MITGKLARGLVDRWPWEDDVQDVWDRRCGVQPSWWGGPPVRSLKEDWSDVAAAMESKQGVPSEEAIQWLNRILAR